MAKGQAKKTCIRSSWSEAQLAQLVRQVTPLSSNRTRVDKHPRHIRQIRKTKVFIFLKKQKKEIIFVKK